VNAESGKLGDTNFAVTDKAAHVCPTGAILIKRRGYKTPIGHRIFDHKKINEIQAESDHE
jgi:[NiFe] hydrogenase diaphorase moiety small subunit